MSLKSALTPWHMWGTSKSLTSNADVSGGQTATTQMIKVNYGRPETFSFFFGAELIAATTPAANMDVVVLIDLIAGVGRDHFDTQQVDPTSILVSPAFVRFVFTVVPPFIPGPNNRKYTTVGSGPPLDDTAPLVVPAIEWIAAQDIQARAQARVSGPAGSSATVQVTGWVAPRSHVRPDWFIERFNGDEVGGT